MTDQQVKEFQRTIWQYYAQHGRYSLPWRIPEACGSFDPYKVLVSEVMLQQTQVSRVIPKYLAFLDDFPTFEILAAVPLGKVLRAWNGLGYNRRAKFLLESAQVIMSKYQGSFPVKLQQLTTLPGVGINTAGAIMVYAFNIPVVFIETNIRTVFIHHFFTDETRVTDKSIAAFGEETMDMQNPREWYWALMDYGSFLKQSVGNKSRASNLYVRQTPFAGSIRQLRGTILRVLVEQPLTMPELTLMLSDDRLPTVIEQLVHEGLVKDNHGHFCIP